jgi:LPXTG-motif cell wall-anchored protein
LYWCSGLNNQTTKQQKWQNEFLQQKFLCITLKKIVGLLLKARFTLSPAICQIIPEVKKKKHSFNLTLHQLTRVKFSRCKNKILATVLTCPHFQTNTYYSKRYFKKPNIKSRPFVDCSLHCINPIFFQTNSNLTNLILQTFTIKRTKQEIIHDLAGQDATEDYDDVGHSEEAHEILKKYYIGELDKSAPVPSGGSSSAATASSSSSASSTTPAPSQTTAPPKVVVEQPKTYTPTPAPYKASTPIETVKSQPPSSSEDNTGMMIAAGLVVAAVAAGFFFFRKSKE